MPRKVVMICRGITLCGRPCASVSGIGRFPVFFRPFLVKREKRCGAGAVPTVPVAAFRLDFFQMAAWNAIAPADVGFALLQIVETRPKGRGRAVGHQPRVDFAPVGITQPFHAHAFYLVCVHPCHRLMHRFLYFFVFYGI